MTFQRGRAQPPTSNTFPKKCSTFFLNKNKPCPQMLDFQLTSVKKGTTAPGQRKRCWKPPIPRSWDGGSFSSSNGVCQKDVKTMVRKLRIFINGSPENDENESGTKWWKWWKWLCQMSYLFCGFGFEFCRGMFRASTGVLQSKTSLAVKHCGSKVSTGDDSRIPNHHDGQKFPRAIIRTWYIHGSNLSHPKIWLRWSQGAKQLLFVVPKWDPILGWHTILGGLFWNRDTPRTVGRFNSGMCFFQDQRFLTQGPLSPIKILCAIRYSGRKKQGPNPVLAFQNINNYWCICKTGRFSEAQWLPWSNQTWLAGKSAYLVPWTCQL